MADKTPILRPEEIAYLTALAGRLSLFGYTCIEGGVATDSPTGPYVYVNGIRGGRRVECSFGIRAAGGMGAALQALSEVMDREAAKRGVTT